MLLLSILAVAIGVMVPAAKAQTQPTMTVTPTYGPPGTYVTCYGFGFAPNGIVTISIFTTTLGSKEATCDTGDVALSVTIPTNVPNGQYTLTATDDSGNSANAVFTVTSGGPPATTPKPTQSAAPIVTSSPGVVTTGTPWSYPTIAASQAPTTTGGSSFSPLLIGIIVVVIIAVLIPMTLFYRRRGGGESLVEDSPPAFTPGMPSRPATSPVYGSQVSATPRPATSTYSQQLTRPTMTARPTQTSAFGGTTATRMCPGCKRPVKDYYSICPYCHRKLK